MDRRVIVDSQYKDWRSHPVTQLFLDEIIEHIEVEMAALATGAGMNPTADRFAVGKIAGLTLLADWKPQLVEDTNEV